jgi:hypothetical protein
MNHVNLGSVPATTGRVHATIGRVPGTIGRVSEIIGRVSAIVVKMSEEIDTEYHICLMSYRFKPDTSDMFYRWIIHVQ